MVDVKVEGEETVSFPPPDESKGLNKELMHQFLEAFKRRRNAKKVGKLVTYEREKLKKSKRRESNKSRKINQAKNRLNKFQNKK